MPTLSLSCPNCGRFLVLNVNGEEVSPPDCRFGVLISAYNSSMEDMIKSLCETWDWRKKVTPQSRMCGSHEAIEFTMGDDIRVIALKSGNQWIAFSDCE